MPQTLGRFDNGFPKKNACETILMINRNLGTLIESTIKCSGIFYPDVFKDLLINTSSTCIAGFQGVVLGYWVLHPSLGNYRTSRAPPPGGPVQTNQHAPNVGSEAAPPRENNIPAVIRRHIGRNPAACRQPLGHNSARLYLGGGQRISACSRATGDSTLSPEPLRR